MQGNRIAGYCLAAVCISLLLVGIVSGTTARHLLQIVPMVAAIIALQKNNAYWLMLAWSFLLFWLLIMLCIWLFLFGIAKIVSGHYTTSEIILTVVMAFTSSYGLFRSFDIPYQENKYLLTLTFIAGFFIQYGFLILSYRLM